MPQAFAWRSRVIILAMWAATAVGLSLNMTSPDPLPAGGTVTVVWARDNGVVTPNPSQFGLYVFPDVGDNLVVSQVINAGSQPSGTVTMVMPPETSPGSYDIYAFEGPDMNTPPAMWGWGFNLAAAVQSASANGPGSTAVTSNSGSQTSSGDPQTLSGLSHSSTATSNNGSRTLSGASQSITAPTKSSVSNSISSDTNSATSAGAATGGSSSTAIVLTTKHAIPTGAIAGIVVGLLLTVVGIALLLLFLRRRRQQARRRFSAPETNHPISLSTPLFTVTPFTGPPPPTMTQIAVPIREKDAVIGLSVSPTTTSSASGSSSQLPPGTISEREHRERVERLEHEVQLLRQAQQQNTNFSDEPPPEYNTL